MRMILQICCCLLLLTTSVKAGDIYVSADVKTGGDGTKSKPLTLVEAVGKKGIAKAGDRVLLDAGTYKVEIPEKYREMSLDVAVNGSRARPIVIMAEPGCAAVIDGAIQLSGNFVSLIGLEIGCLDWDPRKGKNWKLPAVKVIGEGVKLINCNIFGGRYGGVAADQRAVDFKMYGCLVHDFGFLVTSKYPMDIGDVEMVRSGQGVGVSLRNEKGTKVLRHNIVWRGCNGNFSSTRDANVGYDYIENIAYESMGLKGNESMDNFCVAGNYGKKPMRMDRIRVIGNVAYQSSAISNWRPNMRLYTYHKHFPGIKAEVRDNWLIGANVGLLLTAWDDLTVKDNTIWALSEFVQVAKESTQSWRVSGNHYIDNGKAAKAFAGGDLASWQKRGFDKDSKLLPGKSGKPTGMKIFAFPNIHERNRGNIAVFNFDEAPQANVDLSKVVKKGVRIQVWNCWDLKSTFASTTPVFSGTYQGGKLNIPLKNRPDCPWFEAFVVRETSGNNAGTQ